MSDKNQLETIILTVLRVSLGWIFLWAFLDKTFGLGFSTARDKSWINGGSPTYGFLKFGTQGKALQDLFQPMATSVFVEWLFMLGLLAIGVATILGICRKIAGVSGIILLVLMWMASIPLEHNPIMDDHLIYALAFAFFAVTKNIGYIFIPNWENNKIVTANPILL